MKRHKYLIIMVLLISVLCYLIYDTIEIARGDGTFEKLADIQYLHEFIDKYDFISTGHYWYKFNKLRSEELVLIGKTGKEMTSIVKKYDLHKIDDSISEFLRSRSVSVNDRFANYDFSKYCYWTMHSKEKCDIYVAMGEGGQWMLYISKFYFSD